MNISFCGMMGVGKTSVGLKVAHRLGKRWYDTDQLITEEHGRITDIFEYYGEKYFRDLETETVKRLMQEDDIVISTGGGLVLRLENNAALHEKDSLVLYLSATFETLVQRVTVNESRPLLQENIQQTLRNLLAERDPVYRASADYTVETDGKTLDEVVDEAVAFIQNYRPEDRYQTRERT